MSVMFESEGRVVEGQVISTTEFPGVERPTSTEGNQRGPKKNLNPPR
jgi:hypothetical protein